MPIDDHRQDNLANWNDRVAIHTGPDGYEIDRLVNDPDAASAEVSFDKEYLGDVTGLSLLHLQCHIGTDTVSWAKLGARVTGLDFSPVALDYARSLAERMEIEATFVESEFYEARSVLTEEFDIVYTSVGTITWLPDIRAWAEIVASYVRPGGRFYIRDGHPMLYTLDDEREDDVLVVAYPYFETTEPITFDDEHSYVGSGTVENSKTNEWNHGLGEIITSMIDAGLRIDLVHEHKGLDWKAMPSMTEVDGRWVLPTHQQDFVPLEYSILATKPT